MPGREGSFHNVLSRRGGWRGQLGEEGCVEIEECGGRGGEEAIEQVEVPGREGSFHNVLSRRGGWRGQVEESCSVLSKACSNWFNSPAGQKQGEEKENMGQSIISEKKILIHSIYVLSE